MVFPCLKQILNNPWDIIFTSRINIVFTLYGFFSTVPFIFKIKSFLKCSVVQTTGLKKNVEFKNSIHRAKCNSLSNYLNPVLLICTLIPSIPANPFWKDR